MTTRIGGLALLAFLLAPLSCSSPMDAPWDGGPLLETHGSEFQVIPSGGSWKVSVPYSFTNETGHAVFLANCQGGFSANLERKVKGGWVTAWSPILLLCASAPIRIGTGAEFQDTLRVVAYPPGGNAAPRFAIEDVEGIYRIRWDAAYSKGGVHAGILPLKYRISNEFLLRYP